MLGGFMITRQDAWGDVMSQQNLITTIDEFETEYKKGIGTILPIRATKEASLDNIRRFGDGVGDYNPLWRDEKHAEASRFGMITAPPTFIYGVSLGVVDDDVA